jgi:hypothetical protein
MVVFELIGYLFFIAVGLAGLVLVLFPDVRRKVRRLL